MDAPARRFALRGAVLVVALSFGLSGCAPSPSPDRTTTASASASDSATRSGTGEIRHDLGPLTERFPQLEGATDATWMSGTLGDDRVPGPSTYWIDAVVTLDEASYAAVRAQAGSTELDEDAQLPELDPGLDDVLPSGPFVRSQAIDDAFSVDGRSTVVVLDDATRTVILTSRFQ
jgi:hypothetical protein